MLSFLRVTAVLFCLVVGTHAAQAGILRSSDGMPVLTKDGNCVTTGWSGEEDCAAAKQAAGLGVSGEGTATGDAAHDKVVYFGFNKSGLTPQAKHRLDHLAKKLRWMAQHKQAPKSITVVGYADRIGNADYNKKLSLRRAEAVRAYLHAQGVKTKIEMRSLGKTAPKADCSADLPHAQLIHCLREDRRVEVEF